MIQHRLVRTLTAVALTLTIILSVAPVIAQERGQQVVIGSVSLPSQGLVAGPYLEKCDPRSRTSLDNDRGRLAVENGIISFWFRVDPRTHNEGFILQPTNGRDVDLDIIFINPATGYSTQRLGGERGTVPDESEWGIVCLSSGNTAEFRYTAGPGIRGFVASEEASWTSHTSNIRLIGRAFAPHSVKRLAFQEDLAVVGSGTGLSLYGIHERKPYIEYLSFLECPGGHGDISIWGDYAFQSVPHEWPYFFLRPGSDWNRSQSERCNNTDDSFEAAGIRVVDISDRREPRQVKFFKLPCGAMNHTLFPHRGKMYMYVPVPCDEDSPAIADNVRPLNYQIQILRFNPDRPQEVEFVGTPQIDDVGGQLGCHDITVFPKRNLAACPQFFNDAMRTSLLDISDPLNPKVIKRLEMPERSVWMAYATFTWDGRYLVIADTTGSDYFPDRISDCSGADEQDLGALWIYDVGDPVEATLVGSFELPRRSLSLDHACAPSEVSIIPTRDSNRHVAVLGWTGGGMVMVDLSNPTKPREIGHWTPPAASEIRGSHFYNGRVYSLEYWTGPGIRVFELEGFGSPTTMDYRRRLNPQTQVMDFRK